MVKSKLNILFLGETYRADAITWINGIEKVSGLKINTQEIPTVRNRVFRMVQSFIFINSLTWKKWFGKKYDFVLAERITSYGFFSIFSNAKIKIVAQQGITDVYPETGLSKIFKQVLARVVYQKSDLIHAWGYAMTYAQLKLGASPLKIVVRPKGLDLTRYSFIDHLAVQDLHPQAIVTRSLSHEYRHVDIIKAVGILKSKQIFLKVWIVGDGPLKNELIDLCKKYGVEDLIEFMGRVDNDLLPSLLQKCTIYISTPVTEGVSSSLFEAMACGCIPVVTQLPGNKAFIKSNYNGELITVASPDVLAATLMKVVQNPQNYKNGIAKNRNYIDQFVNREINMVYFYEQYLKLLSSK